jgi:hypothetical protein
MKLYETLNHRGRHNLGITSWRRLFAFRRLQRCSSRSTGKSRSRAVPLDPKEWRAHAKSDVVWAHVPTVCPRRELEGRKGEEEVRRRRPSRPPLFVDAGEEKMERDGCRKSSPASPSATSSSTAGRGRDPAELRGTAMAGRRRRMPARARSGRARSRVALEADPRARRRRRHCWSFMDVRTHRVPPLHPDLVAASEQGNGREGAPRRVHHRHGGPCLARFVGRLVGHLTSPPGDRDRCGLARPATDRILLLCFRVSPTTRRSVSRRRSYFGAATADPPRLDVFLAAMEDRRPIPVGARSRVLCHRRMSLPGPTAALL